MHTVIEKDLEANLPPTFWLAVFTEHLDYTISQKSPDSEMKNYGSEK